MIRSWFFDDSYINLMMNYDDYIYIYMIIILMIIVISSLIVFDCFEL